MILDPHYSDLSPLNSERVKAHVKCIFHWYSLNIYQLFMLKHVLNNKFLTYLLVLKNIVYLYLYIYMSKCERDIIWYVQNCSKYFCRYCSDIFKQQTRCDLNEWKVASPHSIGKWWVGDYLSAHGRTCQKMQTGSYYHSCHRCHSVSFIMLPPSRTKWNMNYVIHLFSPC